MIALPWLALLLLVVALVSSGPLSATLYIVAGALALWRLRPSRLARIVGGAAILAGLVVAGGLLHQEWIDGDRWLSSTQHRFDSWLEDILTAAARGEREVEQELREGSRLSLFRHLATSSGDGFSRLIVDRDGEAVAWAGPGFLNDVFGQASDTEAVQTAHSLTAATAFVRRQLPPSSTGWTLTVGVSQRSDVLPFRPPPGLRPDDFRWLVRDPTDDSAAGGHWRLDSALGPTLVLEMHPGRDPGRRVARRWSRVAQLALGLALLFGTLLQRPEERAPAVRAAMTTTIVTAGLVAVLLAAGMSRRGLVALAVAAVVACAVLLVRRSRPGGTVTVLAAGWLLAVLLPLAAWFEQSHNGPLDLAASFLPSADGIALRLAMMIGALGALLLVAEGADRLPRWRPELQWALAFAATALAAAWHDAWLPASLAAAGGAFLVVSGIELRRTVVSRVALAVLAVLLAATLWEGMHRRVLRRASARFVADQLSRPSEQTVAAVESRAVDYFRSPTVAQRIEEARQSLPQRDLALALWQDSPLADRGALSALTVEFLDGSLSTFSYGLPLREGDLDLTSGRWASEPLIAARDSWRQREVGLATSGGTVSRLRFWWVPVQGYDARTDAGSSLVSRLLQRRELLRPSLPAAAATLARYDDRGRAVYTAWQQADPLSPDERASPAGRRRTPDGPSWYWGRSIGGERWVLYLPQLGWLTGLERVGVHAWVSLAVLVVLGAAALLMRLGKRADRQGLLRWLRSYPRRLMLLLTLLLAGPLLALSLLLLQATGQRLATIRRQAAQESLTIAKRLVGDHVQEMDPGFGLRTALEDYLPGLERLVGRAIHVYWGHEFFVSSQPELFTAGLLPQQLPGQVFADLALLGQSVSWRRNRLEDGALVELYTRLDLAGSSPGQRAFYLSTPLAAAADEEATDLARLRRQATLVTTLLLGLVLVVATRAARGFTRPLMEIVHGTARIASGARSLGLQPSEPELATLVGAIDEMADRIADARGQLLREKRVVEQVVEHITSAIVLVGAGGKVLMCNRVAEELLGTTVSEPLASAAASDALQEFLAQGDGELRQSTVKLQWGGEQREWRVAWVPIAADRDPAALLVVEDETDILRGQRLEAWAEMARIIAHEVKNPLTPIKLSTEHLRQIYERDPDRLEEAFDRCTRNILDQVETLRQIASEFSTYSHIPGLDTSLGDLVSLARDATDAYRVAPPVGVRILFASEVAELPCEIDAPLLARALRNLLENAIRASSGGGEVTVGVGEDGDNARLTVADRGPGVPEESLARIFEPYFSTHDSGTGLGLPIAKRIVEEHGGSMTAHNRAAGGLRVDILLPRAGNPRPKLDQAPTTRPSTSR